MTEIKEALPFWCSKSFYDMKEYYSLTFGNLLLIILELWSTSLTSLLAGTMSNDLLAVKTSLNSLYVNFYSFC